MLSSVWTCYITSNLTKECVVRVGSLASTTYPQRALPMSIEGAVA